MKRVCSWFNLSICAASTGIFPPLQPHRPPRTHVCTCRALCLPSPRPVASPWHLTRVTSQEANPAACPSSPQWDFLIPRLWWGIFVCLQSKRIQCVAYENHQVGTGRWGELFSPILAKERVSEPRRWQKRMETLWVKKIVKTEHIYQCRT